MAIDITKVKEFIKNTTDAKIMDVNHKDNTIKISELPENLIING